MSSWPAPDARTAALIRRAAERLLADPTVVPAVVEASIGGLAEPAIVADPLLLADESLVSHAEVLQWLTANVSRPGLPVAPYVGDEVVAYVQDRARRGLHPDVGAAWRAALLVAWRRWAAACLDLTEDRGLLTDVLDVSLRSMLRYADESVAVVDAFAAEMGDNAGLRSETQILATLDLVLSDAPISPTLAGAQLGYRLEQHHVAAVVWCDPSDRRSELDEAVRALQDLPGCCGRLGVTASGAARWVWLAAREVPSEGAVLRALAGLGSIRVAFGDPGRGMAGFRVGHEQAVATQGVLIRLGSPRRVARYADVALVDPLTRDRETAARFVRETLGDLAGADRGLRSTMLEYVRSGFSTSRAAERLYAHRNTVERRLARANELSATKLEVDPVRVAAALLVLELQEDG